METNKRIKEIAVEARNLALQIGDSENKEKIEECLMEIIFLCREFDDPLGRKLHNDVKCAIKAAVVNINEIVKELEKA